MPARALTPCLIAVVMLVSRPATAQTLSEAQVKRWADAMIHDAGSDDYGADLKLTVIERITWHPSRETIESTKRALASRPDHPDRYKIPMWERHINGEFTETKYVIWHESRGSYRASLSGDLTQRDVVRTEHAAWGMGVDSVSYFDPSDLPPGEVASATSSFFRYRVADFINPFLGVQLQGSESPRVTRRGESWGLEYPRIGSQGTSGIALLVAESDGEPVVSMISYPPPPKTSNRVPSQRAYLEYRFDPVLQRQRPAVVSYRFEDGVEERQYELVSLERLDPDEFQRVTAYPQESSPDPLRGWSESIQVTDLRDGWHTVETTFGTEAAIPGPDPDAASSEWEWGVVASGGILVLIVAGVVYASRRT